MADLGINFWNPQAPLRVINYIPSYKIEPSFHPFPRLPKELQLKIWAAAIYRPRVFFGAWWKPKYSAGFFSRPRSHIQLQKDLALALPLAKQTQSKFLLTCKDAEEVARGYARRTQYLTYASYSEVAIESNFELDWFIFYCGEIEEGLHTSHSSFMKHYAPKLRNVMLMMDDVVDSDTEVVQRLAIAFKDFGKLEKVQFLFNNKTVLLGREKKLRIAWEEKLGKHPKALFATVEKGLRAVGDEYRPRKWKAARRAETSS